MEQLSSLSEIALRNFELKSIDYAYPSRFNFVIGNNNEAFKHDLKAKAKLVNYPITKERPIKRLELYYDDDSKCLYGMQIFDKNNAPMLKLGWFHHGDDDVKIVIDLKEGQKITGFRSSGPYEEEFPATHMHFQFMICNSK